MIKSSVLHKLSNEEGVRPQQIEKDYMISWLLWGISNHNALNQLLIFKGGTCLNKIHIEDYRYSEDMDFTMNPEMEDEISNDKIYSTLEDMFVAIEEVSKIGFSISEASKFSPRGQKRSLTKCFWINIFVNLFYTKFE